ncbi:MAG: cation:proton antiporter [Sedimentisphaerales bacterium]
MLVTNREVTPIGLSWDFIQIVGIGLLIGTAVGLAASQLTKQVDEPMIEITITTIAAYGSFLVAEQLHYSGVIATVTAGMLCGNYGVSIGMSPSTRIAIESFWEYIAFALNSIVFLLIGFEVNLESLLDSWQEILVAYFVVTGARAFVIYAVSFLLRHTRERIPWAWSVILTWGGLRGALPMVLALSLAPNFPHRDRIVTMAFGVIIISILVHGLTMSPLLKWLGIVRGHEERMEYELTRGRLQADHAALAEIDHMANVYFTRKDVISNLRKEYEQKVDRDSSALEEMDIEKENIKVEESKWAARHLLLVEKNEVIDAFHHGVISHIVYKELISDLDRRLLDLESRKQA